MACLHTNWTTHTHIHTYTHTVAHTSRLREHNYAHIYVCISVCMRMQVYVCRYIYFCSGRQELWNFLSFIDKFYGPCRRYCWAIVNFLDLQSSDMLRCLWTAILILSFLFFFCFVSVCYTHKKSSKCTCVRNNDTYYVQ